jgi:hypothetical protein
MTIRNKIDALYHYLLINRGVGHTTLIKKGIENYNKDKFILTKNLEQGDMMGCRRSEIITLGSLLKLRGCSRPMVIDNEALVELLREVILEWDDLYKEKMDLERMINHRGSINPERERIININPEEFINKFH